MTRNPPTRLINKALINKALIGRLPTGRRWAAPAAG